MTGSRLTELWSRAVGRPHWRRFAADRDGATAMIVTLGAPVIFGFTALAVDVGMWRAEQARLQAAVDVATLAAAFAQMEAADETERAASSLASWRATASIRPIGTTFVMTLVEREDAYALRGRAGSSRDRWRPTISPSCSSTIRRSRGSALGGVDAGQSRPHLRPRPGTSDQPSSVQFRGNPDIDLNCSVASNSEDVASSMEVAGNSVINASALIAAGGITNIDSANITADAIWPEAPPVVDPFGPYGRDLQPPPSATCDSMVSSTSRRTSTLTPGRYCGGIRVNGATATFSPGLYVIYNGDLQTIGQAGLVGEGVTFVLTGSSANQVGSMDFAGGTDLDLSAPEAGTPWAAALGYDGVLFYQDPNTAGKLSNGGDNKLLGGTIARLDGAVYFPRQTLMYTGGAELKDGCLMLVARQVYFRGNAEFVQTDEACDELGVEPLRLPSVKLLG